MTHRASPRMTWKMALLWQTSGQSMGDSQIRLNLSARSWCATLRNLLHPQYHLLRISLLPLQLETPLRLHQTRCRWPSCGA